MKAFYDSIARKWHSVTGAQGGALKKFVLNDLVLGKIPGIAGVRILELGCGNGYFLPMLLRRFSGQVPSQITITDQSQVLLDLARRFFRVPDSDYRVLDVRTPFPFSADSFDLILANMIFNELTGAGLRRALRECRRTLASEGRLIATVTHPVFVESLERRGQLKPTKVGIFTMPGSDGLRLPVVPRSKKDYCAALEQAGFRFSTEDIFPTPPILNAKPGLSQAGGVPIAMLIEGKRNGA